MSCIVRPRRAEDLPVLANVLVRVHERDGYPVEGVANPVGWLDHPRALASWTATTIDDVPIGQVTLAVPDLSDDAARVWAEQTGRQVIDLALVARLFVDPDHRSQKAGRTLMTTALSYARNRGLQVALDVMAKDVAAIRLYRSLDGEVIGNATHIHSGNRSESALVIAFSFD